VASEAESACEQRAVCPRLVSSASGDGGGYWWRRELIRRGAETQGASFVPVRVTDAPARDGDPQIEIVLTDGRRVRLTGPVNRETLTEVLDVLERRAC
jgi:hypothetical protein